MGNPNNHEVVGRVIELAPIIHVRKKSGAIKFYQYGVLRYLSGRRLCAIFFVASGMRDITRCGLKLGAYGRMEFAVNAKPFHDGWRNVAFAHGFTHMTEQGYKAFLDELRKQGLYAPNRNWRLRLSGEKMLPAMHKEETYDDRDSLPF